MLRLCERVLAWKSACRLAGLRRSPPGVSGASSAHGLGPVGRPPCTRSCTRSCAPAPAGTTQIVTRSSVSASQGLGKILAVQAPLLSGHSSASQNARQEDRDKEGGALCSKAECLPRAFRRRAARDHASADSAQRGQREADEDHREQPRAGVPPRAAQAFPGPRLCAKQRRRWAFER